MDFEELLQRLTQRISEAPRLLRMLLCTALRFIDSTIVLLGIPD